MPAQPPERSERIAVLIEDQSVDELRRTTVQAIDHAHKSAAEVAEALARFEGAMGLVAQLRDENRRLREANKDLRRELDAMTSSRTWRSGLLVTAPVRWARQASQR